jgi:hypothetical protein
MRGRLRFRPGLQAVPRLATTATKEVEDRMLKAGGGRNLAGKMTWTEMLGSHAADRAQRYFEDLNQRKLWKNWVLNDFQT